ncbi:hypothetical protein M231_07109 [Tremella mesenterica]|uniref:Efficient mitochondria targeting-associated protein 19 n=1 Tax=Tremella mesenterica TaxID=5217 RepID=A0A4Q1BA39_TREME|nr:uncharacterized protein TREMEDRAFT_65012 [Tremella mesenterica DSM 1558]EIW67144.1 hypothetical protein TREMEDRAFT_65012 [Tremella mesenterica DSM 1558]RXK35629.1 hypothetical protein M231_07109 [Tremella mesenterica]
MSSKGRFAGRPMDRVWFIFCVVVTLTLDCTHLYPPALIAKTPLPRFQKWYIAWSRDPIVTGATGTAAEWGWLRTFVWMELLFQVPCFLIGAVGLYRNDKRVYPILLAYGASTSTTLIPALSAILTYPVQPPLTKGEIGTLLASYLPILILPTILVIDMSIRILGIIKVAEERKRV